MFHGVTRCYMGLHGITWCYTLLHSVTRCYMVLHGVTWCYTVLHVVIFLDFHSTKQGLSLVDSWSRGLD